MKKLLSLMAPYRFAITIAIFLMLIELISELIQPLLLAKIIDDGIVKGDGALIIQWGGILLLLSFIAFAAGITNSFYAAHVSQSVGFDVRHQLYKKIQSFSFANIDQFASSSLITRLTNDVTQIQQLIFMGLRIMLRAPLLVVGGLVMALFINFKLALILLLVVPIALTLLFYFMRKGAFLFRAVQKRLDAINAVMQENLSAILLVKAFLRGEYEAKRFNETNENLQAQTVQALRVVEIVMPLLLLLMNISIIVILWFGAEKVQTETVQVGEVVAIINYITRITGALSVFTFLIMIFSRASASAGRMNEVLDANNLMEEKEITTNVMELKGKVELDGVSFRYPNTEPFVLSDISLTCKPMDTVAILGATGTGKSSLLQLIPRLYDVSGGSIRIDGVDVRDMSLTELRGAIGYVAQESLLFSGTIKDNLLWGKEDATQEEIMEACENAQIAETIRQLPKGYETVIGQKGVNLSGGQKQRLSIARALLRKPQILLLDDSTSALDMKTERKLLQAIKAYRCTMFIVTQKVSTTMEADKIVILEEGRIIAEGTHQQLISNSAIYQKLVEIQAGEER